MLVASTGGAFFLLSSELRLEGWFIFSYVLKKIQMRHLTGKVSTHLLRMKQFVRGSNAAPR
jgi:hypothetical protein